VSRKDGLVITSLHPRSEASEVERAAAFGPLRPDCAPRRSRECLVGRAPAPAIDHELTLALTPDIDRLPRTAAQAEVPKTRGEDGSRRQTDVLAFLAHELRGPLAPLRNAAAMLGQPLDPVAAKRLSAVIDRQVDHLSRLVDDLLDVSRVGTGKLRLDWRTVELAEVAQRAAEACGPAMKARRQNFELRGPVLPLEVRGDPGRLLQILRNLLDNASKYTPPGGDIALAMTVSATEASISVRDNGIGIPEDALTRIFEPFVQEVSAVGVNGSGLGLGLALARQLVEAHGGTLVARSAGPGHGSEFVVTLAR